MGLSVNTNIAALNAYRNLSNTQSSLSSSLEKLSSGLRINRAADDAAGLSISEGLRSQISGTQQAVRNAQDGISVVQTAEGALTETHSILQRMRTLSVQGANDGGLSSDAKQSIQSEMNELTKELNRISSTTQFNGSNLLDGSYSSSFQVGANTSADDKISVTIGEHGRCCPGCVRHRRDLCRVQRQDGHHHDERWRQSAPPVCSLRRRGRRTSAPHRRSPCTRTSTAP